MKAQVTCKKINLRKSFFINYAIRACMCWEPIAVNIGGTDKYKVTFGFK